MALKDYHKIRDTAMIDIDHTIELLNDWTQRKLSYDNISAVTPEMIKALAALIEFKSSQQKKRTFFRFLKERDWWNVDFWSGAFFAIFAHWVLFLCASMILHFTG